MKKSILLLGNHPPPYGGVPTHIKYLSEHLAKRNWNVQVVSFAGRQSGIEDFAAGYRVYRLSRSARWSRFLHLSRHDVVYLVRNQKLLLRSPRTVLSWLLTTNFLRKVIRQHGVRIVSAYHLLNAVIGMGLSAELDIRLVTTVFGEIYSHMDIHRRYLPEIRQVITHSQRLLSCSHHCAESLKLLGLDPRVEVVYYGIDTSRFVPGNGGTSIRLRYGISSDALLTLYVGRMVREMGLHVLLDAIPDVLSRCPQAVFLIAGASGELTTNASTVSQRYPGRVFVVADVPDAELPRYYDACDLSVAPSINARACLGLAIAEAMATGKAVIGSRVGGTAEVLVDGETGVLVPPEDSSALADTIVRLLKDPLCRQQMGLRGRQRALDMFDKDRTNQRMEQIFEEVLA